MKVVVALFDIKSGLFMQPMFVPSVGIACRNIQDEISRGGPDNVLANHHEDFKLYQLGLFEEETGGFILEDKPKELVLVSTLRKE